MVLLTWAKVGKMAVQTGAAAISPDATPAANSEFIVGDEYCIETEGPLIVAVLGVVETAYFVPGANLNVAKY